MAKKKVTILAASAALTLAVAAGAAACSGSYKLTDFVVAPSGVKTTYAIGESVDLSGLSMTAMFSDDTTENVNLSDVKIYLGEEDITSNLSKITESVGAKKIKIVYSTKYGEDYYEITITVLENVETVTILGFNEPTFVSDYKANIANRTDDPTDVNFEQKFFANDGTEYYVVGDDNAFKFLPIAQAFDEETHNPETLVRFTADSTVKVLDGSEYVALTKSLKADTTAVYEYYQGTTLLVTEDAANNTFDFADGTIGKVFKLSVKPDAGVYEYEDVDAVEFEVKIVDGFNVYKAGELSVFDNTDRTEWTALKTANGVKDVATNGVILHQNTILEAADIPEAFQYTLPANYNVKYRDTATNIVGSPEDFGLTRTFLKNQYDGNPVIYERLLTAGQSFNFYGNYFDLDLTKVPLVASFQPTGMGESESWYGSDFSNTALFRAEGQTDTSGAQDEHFNFYNLAMKGNAKVDQLVLDDSTEGQHTDETLVYAGGLICTKVDAMTAQYDNARVYNFFISLFAETKEGGQAIANYNRTKVYDSFQDALFLWGNADANITNCYFKRAGGPLILMQHIDPDTNDVDIPNVTIDENSVMEAYLTGSEIWFSTIGGATVIEQIKAMDGLFNPAGKTFLINGKMNIVALLTCDGSSVDEVLGATDVQGSVNYKGCALDRMNDTLIGATVHQIMAQFPNAPIFTFGNSAYIYTAGNGGLPLIVKPDMSDGSTDMGMSAYGSKYFTLHMGGLSAFFELGNLPV
jgi:hypothetical protein